VGRGACAKYLYLYTHTHTHRHVSVSIPYGCVCQSWMCTKTRSQACAHTWKTATTLLLHIPVHTRILKMRIDMHT